MHTGTSYVVSKQCIVYKPKTVVAIKRLIKSKADLNAILENVIFQIYVHRDTVWLEVLQEYNLMK